MYVFSVVDSNLVNIWKSAKKNAPSKGIIDAICQNSVPGLTIIITPKNPIITDPYISSTDELMKKWKNILKQEKRPIIGINWQGNPNAEKEI